MSFVHKHLCSIQSQMLYTKQQAKRSESRMWHLVNQSWWLPWAAAHRMSLQRVEHWITRPCPLLPPSISRFFPFLSPPFSSGLHLPTERLSPQRLSSNRLSCGGLNCGRLPSEGPDSKRLISERNSFLERTRSRLKAGKFQVFRPERGVRNLDRRQMEFLTAAGSGEVNIVDTPRLFHRGDDTHDRTSQEAADSKGYCWIYGSPQSSRCQDYITDLTSWLWPTQLEIHGFLSRVRLRAEDALPATPPWRGPHPEKWANKSKPLISLQKLCKSHNIPQTGWLHA